MRRYIMAMLIVPVALCSCITIPHLFDTPKTKVSTADLDKLMAQTWDSIEIELVAYEMIIEIANHPDTSADVKVQLEQEAAAKQAEISRLEGTLNQLRGLRYGNKTK